MCEEARMCSNDMDNHLWIYYYRLYLVKSDRLLGITVYSQAKCLSLLIFFFFYMQKLCIELLYF